MAILDLGNIINIYKKNVYAKKTDLKLSAGTHKTMSGRYLNLWW